MIRERERARSRARFYFSGTDPLTGSFTGNNGELAEWLKAHDWKSCICSKGVSRVRIPRSPKL